MSMPCTPPVYKYKNVAKLGGVFIIVPFALVHNPAEVDEPTPEPLYWAVF